MLSSKFCPICGSDIVNNYCTKCRKDFIIREKNSLDKTIENLQSALKKEADAWNKLTVALIYSKRDQKNPMNYTDLYY